MQQGFTFADEPADPRDTSPTGVSLPPVSGNSAAARHASWTGAQAVVETWTARQSAYLELLREAGPLTDQEAARRLQWAVSSINSVRGYLGDRIVQDGHEAHHFVDLTGVERTTRRTRWKVSR